jgi:hypothetical protein
LVVTGLTFAGTHPQDYVITSNGCFWQIAPSGSCTIGVSFAPQEQGASTATLQIASNDPSSPTNVSLAGTGGSPPEGPIGLTGPTGAPGGAGATGATGAKGATAATGPRGPAGPAGTVRCTVKQRKHSDLVTCTVRYPAKAKRTLVRAWLIRGPRTYARTTTSRDRLRLQTPQRLGRGTYTVIIRAGARRQAVTITVRRA